MPGPLAVSVPFAVSAPWVRTARIGPVSADDLTEDRPGRERPIGDLGDLEGREDRDLSEASDPGAEDSAADVDGTSGELPPGGRRSRARRERRERATRHRASRERSRRDRPASRRHATDEPPDEPVGEAPGEPPDEPVGEPWGETPERAPGEEAPGGSPTEGSADRESPTPAPAPVPSSSGRAAQPRRGLVIVLVVALAVAAAAAGAWFAIAGRGASDRLPTAAPPAGTGSTAATGAAQGGSSVTATAASDAEGAGGTTPLARASWELPPLAKLGRVIEYGPDYRKEVALTFNAIESKTPAGFDKRILEILKSEDVDATVFIAGKWLSHNRDAGQSLAAVDRIELANGSWDFPDFSDLATDQIRAQVERSDALIEEVTRRKPVLFRLPYGSYNQRTLRVCEELRVPLIGWDVVSGDPDPKVSAEAMTREILARAQPGSIVIMHINGRGVNTAEALPGIIKGLRGQGLDLVTVSALLR